MSIIKVLSMVVLCLFAIVSTLRGIQNAGRLSQDFQWSPTRIFLEGRNPYVVWLSDNASSEILMTQVPNYLHQLYLILVPFGVLDFDHAKLAWAVVNVFLGVFLSFAFARHYRLDITASVFLLFIFLGSTPFRNGIGNGQHALLMLLFISAPFLIGRGGLVVQGLGYSKYSFAPPFVFYNLFRHGVLATSRGFLLPLVGLLLFCGWTASPLFSAAIQPVQVATGGGIGIGLADVMAVSERLFSFGKLQAVSMALGLCLALSWLIARQPNESQHLPLLCVASLMTFHHLGYDFVFLLPLAAYSLASNDWGVRLVLWLGVGWFWYAIRVIDTFGIPELLTPEIWSSFNFLVLLVMLFSVIRRSGKLVPDA